MKEFNGLDQLAETIKQITESAKKNAQNLNDIKGVFKATEPQVLSRLKTPEERKKYSELMKLSNELLDSAPSKTAGEIYESIENLKRYGEQCSNNT